MSQPVYRPDHDITIFKCVIIKFSIDYSIDAISYDKELMKLDKDVGLIKGLNYQGMQKCRKSTNLYNLYINIIEWNPMFLSKLFDLCKHVFYLCLHLFLPYST